MKHASTHLDTLTQITMRQSDGKAKNAKNLHLRTSADHGDTVQAWSAARVIDRLCGQSDESEAVGISRARRFGAYLHIPFCFHKCHYCDFYSIVDNRDRQETFTRRLIAEIETAEKLLPRRPETIFIGGGTPTLLAPQWWQLLLPAMSEHLFGQATSEITVEANPETLTPELARLLAAGGVNRISIGAQSFNPVHLKTLERWHDPANVVRSIEILRDAGVTNINLDLIFGIPGQTVDDWRDDLRCAIDLEPAHVSCYGLMYEPNTPLTKRMHMGRVTPVEDDIEAAMYELTCEVLGEAGYGHYEISAWAKPGKQCEHNLIYWRNHDWWPIGPSASGHVRGVRWKNIPRLGDYLASHGLPPGCDVERLDDDGRVGETLMLGLRLLGGIPWDEVERLLSAGTRGSQRQSAIERHLDGGLLERRNGTIRLAPRGLLVADSVITELL